MPTNGRAHWADGVETRGSEFQFEPAFGAHFAVATPPGYGLAEEDMAVVGEIAEKTGGSIEAYEDPFTAIKNADVVYTDTWVSMGQEPAQRVKMISATQTRLLKSASVVTWFSWLVSVKPAI